VLCDPDRGLWPPVGFCLAGERRGRGSRKGNAMPRTMGVENRRRVGSLTGEVMETVILREGREIAALAEGDPLRYALELPLNELQSLRRALGPILERRPGVKRALEAIIEYKEQAVSDPGPMGMRAAT
jgi:hypothetical protein